MNTSRFNGQKLGRMRGTGKGTALSLFLVLWCGICLTGRADRSMPVYQIEALFLLNFTKYVDWPAIAFAGSNTPITIGVYGDSKLNEALKDDVAGKTISGRTVVVRKIERPDDFSQCHILFISDSESSRMREILGKASALPILTVGEDEAFAQTGGIINFVLKNGNVRLEIDLTVAKKAGLTISSRLLAVADVVKGKTQ